MLLEVRCLLRVVRYLLFAGRCFLCVVCWLLDNHCVLCCVCRCCLLFAVCGLGAWRRWLLLVVCGVCCSLFLLGCMLCAVL